jgi:hypothetical protein
MTAWTDAIDAQLTALDAYVVALGAERAVLVTRSASAAGQALTELERAIVQLDEIVVLRVLWRDVLVDARELGYLPDPRSRFYNEDLGGFLQ